MPVFNHAALFVLDLEASVHFYQNILGFEMVPEPFKDGLHAWFNIGHGTTLHVIQGAHEKKEYFQSSHLCFSVNSLEDFMAVIQQNQIDWYDNKGIKMK